MRNQSRRELVAARKAAGYTQEALAHVVGVDVRTVKGWEAGDWAPSVYVRPRLARTLGCNARELTAIIDAGVPKVERPASLTSDIEAACSWLDTNVGWRLGTAEQRLNDKLERSRATTIRDRDASRGNVARSVIARELQKYYGHDKEERFYRADCEGCDIQLSILAQQEWLDLRYPLTRESDMFRLSSTPGGESLGIDMHDAERAIQRLVETVTLNVALVNSPLYRLKEYSINRGCLSGSFSVVPFVQYALTTDLLELELIDQLVNRRADMGLPMRDKYLPTVASMLDVSNRFCSGGILALCAIARPGDVHRGPDDFVLLTQERGRQVLNGVGRLSVIPRGFHQPLTDYRADSSLGATLRRELEEELFHRPDVDNTISGSRLADPMHPSRLSEPMRWLLNEPQSVRFEYTAFGFNVLNGNFEVACLVLIEDPEFWSRYGGQIEANWESAGLRQYSTRDVTGIRDLLREETWSSEGLFALIEGLRRLSQFDDERVNLPEINVV